MQGDINQPNWQEAFWGSTYPKLLTIKNKYDPARIFWAKATPGSEKWATVDELKLCKTGL